MDRKIKLAMDNMPELIWYARKSGLKVSFVPDNGAIEIRYNETLIGISYDGVMFKEFASRKLMYLRRWMIIFGTTSFLHK